MKSYEVNFDGIVGPTHNYSGLSFGNEASVKNRQAVSNPKKAALQGLYKMKCLMDLGIKQAVLPPHERPHIPTLRTLGFCGSDSEVVAQAYKDAPELFFSCCSASSMWAANAATVSPSIDSTDGRVHFTAANLAHKFHRSIEAETTHGILQTIFSDSRCFVHHSLLPPGDALSDEGGANHSRFCNHIGEPGLQLFVYGRRAFESSGTRTPALYPARHTLEASKTIARRHLLKSDNVVFAQQNPMAIDAGVFHNDVISVGHENVFFYHEHAFMNTDAVIDEITRKAAQCCQTKITLIKVLESQVSIKDAVASYLFNSQIVTLGNNSKVLIAPKECQELASVNGLLDLIRRDANNSIQRIHYIDLRESMRNGGGPACLRLRVVLNEKEIAAALPSVFLTNSLYLQLTDWVERHYRDMLTPDDLRDPQLLLENCKSLDDLSQILRLGSVYSFQR